MKPDIAYPAKPLLDASGGGTVRQHYNKLADSIKIHLLPPDESLRAATTRAALTIVSGSVSITLVENVIPCKAVNATPVKWCARPPPRSTDETRLQRAPDTESAL